METLKLSEVLRVGPQTGINALIRKRREWEGKGKERWGKERRGQERGRKGFRVLLFALGKGKTLVCEAKNKLLSNTEPASTLLLHFPTPRIVEDECCISLPNCGIVVIASQVD